MQTYRYSMYLIPYMRNKNIVFKGLLKHPYGWGVQGNWLCFFADDNFPLKWNKCRHSPVHITGNQYYRISQSSVSLLFSSSMYWEAVDHSLDALISPVSYATISDLISLHRSQSTDYSNQWNCNIRLDRIFQKSKKIRTYFIVVPSEMVYVHCWCLYWWWLPYYKIQSHNIFSCTNSIYSK